MVLTKIIVERAKAPAVDQTFIRDDETTGLALRITAGGVVPTRPNHSSSSMREATMS